MLVSAQVQVACDEEELKLYKLLVFFWPNELSLTDVKKFCAREPERFTVK
jgi:hypothetical protein